MCLLAVSSPMRPHMVTQADQNTVGSYLQTRRQTSVKVKNQYVEYPS